MALKIVFRACQQALLFPGIDTFRTASEIGTAAQAYFDKCDAGLVLHHQIDFTVPATIVARHQPQALIA